MNIGEIYMYGGSIAPNGFLLCDGSAVSRDTYYGLFDVIGTTYGTGDGNTTFNVPDLSGRVIVGASSSHIASETGGEEAHILTSSEIPSHMHEVPSHGHSSNITATTPVLTHTITQPAFTYSAPSREAQRAGKYGNQGFIGTTSTNATRSANLVITNHSAATCTKTGGVTYCAAFDSTSTGGGDAHNNMQPFATINYVIYTGVVA